MIIAMVYDGYVRSLQILSYSVFISNSIAGCLELPGNLLPLIIMDTLGRRWSFSSTLLLAGLAGVVTGIIPTGLPILRLII